MRTASPLAVALIASLALGCGSDESPDSQPEPSQPAPEESMVLAGTYQIVTSVDLGSDAFASDDLVSLLRGIKDAPITTLLLSGAEDLGISSSFLGSIEGFLSGALPDGWGESLDNLANNIDQALGDFDIVSELEITEGDGRFAASHRVTGVKVTFAGVDTFVDVREHNSPSSAVIDFEGKTITVSEHELPVPVGAAMSAILDGEIARSIEPTATSLGEALAMAAECQDMSDTGIFGGFSLQSVCIAGTVSLADNLSAALGKLDSFDIDMSLTGKSSVDDDDGNGSYDRLEGAWVDGDDSLPFEGSRM